MTAPDSGSDDLLDAILHDPSDTSATVVATEPTPFETLAAFARGDDEPAPEPTATTITLTSDLEAPVPTEDSETEGDAEPFDLGLGVVDDFQMFSETTRCLPLVAVDSGVIELGRTPTGFAVALKAAAVSQSIDGQIAVRTVGPFVKLIGPTNRDGVLQAVGRGLGQPRLFVDEQGKAKESALEPNKFRDRLRNFVERMLQYDALSSLSHGLLLIDGALQNSTFNTPLAFTRRLSDLARQRNCDIVGVSKESGVTVNDRAVTTLLEDLHDAGYRRIRLIDSGGTEPPERYLLGPMYACRFAPGSLTWRVDIGHFSLLTDADTVLSTFVANARMHLGYPNLLRLAHIQSAFTKQEVVALQVRLARRYGLRLRPKRDVGVIFAPFKRA